MCSPLRSNEATHCCVFFYCTANKCAFHGLLSETFPTLFVFSVGGFVFKMAPKMLLKCCFMFLGTERLQCAL